MSDEEPDFAGGADRMRGFFPESFGKQSDELDAAAQIESTRRVPVKKPTENRKSKPPPDDEKDGDGEDSGSDSSDSSDAEDKFPVTHELVFKTHERAVTTIALDPAGGRFATGSVDCTIKLHDFSSMVPNTLRAFKSVDPWQGKASHTDSHAIHRLAFSPVSGGVLLCVTAHPQAKILSRDGDVLTEFVKGDMYLHDMHHTKGHISEITTGTWHPSDRNLCLTAGTDSTLRIWDVNNKRSQKDIIVFKSKAAGSGGRTRMTAVAWSPQVIVAAALDGALVMWGASGPFTRSAAEVRDAHVPGTWTGGLDISSDGRMVVTRGGDDLIKLWDTRKLTRALVTVSHPSTSDHYPTSNIRYAPGSACIIAGSPTGHLHILNPGNLRPEHVTEVSPGSPLVAVEWHAKLDQILVGSANGQTRVLYAPGASSRGALDVMSRAPKKRYIDDDASRTTDQSLAFAGDAITTPRDMHRRGRGGASRGGRDPSRPQQQQRTPFMHKLPDEKHVSQNIPLARMLHEDPREALLKYAEIAEKDPVFTGVWKTNQPVTQYADLSDEDEGPDRKKAKR